jgi:hypothetical protein
VLTYLVPIVPLLALWDGLVSCLRTYSTDELSQMVAAISEPHWRWEISRVKVRSLPFEVTCLLGYPEAGEASGSR